MCLKCGKEDHRAKDCANESFCLKCNIDGHRADQTKCPHYRKLVREKTKSTPGDRRRRYTSVASVITNQGNKKKTIKYKHENIAD